MRQEGDSSPQNVERGQIEKKMRKQRRKHSGEQESIELLQERGRLGYRKGKGVGHTGGVKSPHQTCMAEGLQSTHALTKFQASDFRPGPERD